MERNYRAIIENHLKNLQADIAIVSRSTVQPGVVVTDSKPDFYRLLYVMQGEGWLELNGRRIDTYAGMLLLLPAGTTQAYGITGTEELDIFWCHFHANLGDIELFEALQLPLAVVSADPSDIIQVFERMMNAYHGDALCGGLRVKAALFEAIACFLDSCCLDEKNLGSVDLLSKLSEVVSYIDTHLADNIALEDLAKVAYLHPNYFIGMFKSVIGMPPIQFVNMRRLEAAKRLLTETDENVTSIAAEVGMQIHYLSRMFKQHTGISPKRYRQLHRQLSDNADNSEHEAEWFASQRELLGIGKGG
jgi:AraC family transcriptional regulator, arabinose operon regulatory protein